RIDDSEGPVIVLVDDSVHLNGPIVGVNGPDPEWLLAVAGPEVFSGVHWSGALFAPNGKISFQSGTQRGTVLGREVEVHQGSTFVYHPHGPSWTELCELTGGVGGFCARPDRSDVDEDCLFAIQPW